MSEKTVRISAALVAGLRHSALESLRIADSITPAWLIPIQNTKLVMKNPHITGRFIPVTPRPLLTINPAALIAPSTISPSNATVIQNHFGECRIDDSLSLIHI